MKLHQSSTGALNTITAYGTGFIEINRRQYAHPVLVTPEGGIEAWEPAHFDAIASEHFSKVLAYRPEVLIVGTGDRQRFVHPRLLAALHAARIGVESMDTGAACRTYNILMSEGRKVAAALLV